MKVEFDEYRWKIPADSRFTSDMFKIKFTTNSGILQKLKQGEIWVSIIKKFVNFIDK